MTSKTPKFDAAIEKVFENLVPHERTCPECSTVFRIDADDIALLKKLKVPPYTRCFDCRRQRRFAFVNYTSLYKRPCSAPEHSEDMISAIAPGIDIPVYDYAFWYGEGWDPMSFGEKIDLNSPRAQFLKFARKVPQASMTRDPGSVGSDYTLYGYQFKNCYYTFGGAKSENTNYSIWAKDCKDCSDLLMSNEAELSSHLVSSGRHYKTHFAAFSYDCVESAFLYDCRNVSNSFGCVNLRNKQYCWFNEQLTKEEYEKRRSEVNLGDRNVLAAWKTKFAEFLKTQPIRGQRIDKSENVVGNFSINSTNCWMVVRAIEAQGVRYGDYAIRITDSMNVTVAANGDQYYETSSVSAHSSNVKFSYNGRTCADSEFLVNCRNVSNCFMSVGLQNKQFCIFNKQYTEEEYWPLVDELKTRMLEAGEYGEFFPLEASPYAYNSSLAQVVYPLTAEAARARGLAWHDEGEQQLGGLAATPIAEVPSNIKDVGDEILGKAIQGTEGKAFRIIKPELDFYRSQNLPIPEKHPYNRMLERFKTMNNLRLETENCSSCGVPIYSAYKKSDGYTVLCDACFARTVV